MCLANEQWVRCKGTERQHPWYDTSACNLLILANLLIHNALFSWRSSTCSSGNCKTLLLSLKDEAAHLYDPPRAYGHPKNLQHLYGSAQVQVHLTKANKKTKHVNSGLSEFPCFSVGWWRHLWWTGASIISSSFWLLGQIIRNSTCECMFPNRPNLLSLPEFRWANTPPQKRRKIWINGLRVEATQQRQPITIQDASSEVGISHSVCSQYKVVCSCWHLGSGQKMRSLKYVYVSKQWPEPAVRRRKQVWFGTKKIVSKDFLQTSRKNRQKQERHECSPSV